MSTFFHFGNISPGAGATWASHKASATEPPTAHRACPRTWPDAISNPSLDAGSSGHSLGARSRVPAGERKKADTMGPGSSAAVSGPT
jgi:hypothetical protein